MSFQSIYINRGNIKNEYITLDRLNDCFYKLSVVIFKLEEVEPQSTVALFGGSPDLGAMFETPKNIHR